MATRRTFRERIHHQEGASATMLVISLFAFLAVAIVAIDLGSVYASRRTQVSTTDAAALAVAQRLTQPPCPTQSQMETVATDALTADGDGSALISVTADFPAGGCRYGSVAVETTRDVQSSFGQVFGYGDLDTFTTSIAGFGQASIATGLRPIGICAQDAHYQDEWLPYFLAVQAGGSPDQAALQAAADAEYATLYPTLTAHPTTNNQGESYPPGMWVHRVNFATPTAGSPCGGAGGNFGWLDFDGNGAGNDVDENCDGASGNDELGCDLVNGHQGPIDISNSDCLPQDTTSDQCGPQTGGIASAAAELGVLRCPATVPATDSSCEKLYIVVYDTLSGTGTNADYHIASAVGIVIRGFKTNGNPNTHHLDFEFIDVLGTGVIGPVDPNSTAPDVINLCGTDAIDNCPTSP